MQKGKLGGESTSDSVKQKLQQEPLFTGQKEALVSSPSITKLNINQVVNQNCFPTILKLTNPVIDSENRRLYFGGTKSTCIGIIDIDKDQLVDVFDIGMPCGFLLFDSASGMLYSLEMGGANKVYMIDVKQKNAKEIDSLPSQIFIPRKVGAKSGAKKTYKGFSYIETGYPFEVGYLQDENASYGIIEIKNASEQCVGKIKHGPDALYFDIDQKTGKLYTTNTGDGSISIFDLNNQNRKIKDIDVGTSIDEILLNPKTGGLYIRNRLGGSSLYYYDTLTGDIIKILNENTVSDKGIGVWPTKMILDDDKLYVLSHYGSRIDVINTTTNTVVSHIPLNLSYKPRTDGMSTMAMDKKRKVLYAAFPELGELAVVDAKNLVQVRKINIEGYDKSIINPARIVLVADEEQNKLFVYLSEEHTLNVYNGKNYTLEKKISSIDSNGVERISILNQEKKILYMGNKALSATTLEIERIFPRGNRVVGFQNSKDRVYLSEIVHMGRGKMIEKIYEFEGSILKKEWILSPILSIPSSFAFDFDNDKFYVGYFESAIIEVFSLTTG